MVNWPDTSADERPVRKPLAAHFSAAGHFLTKGKLPGLLLATFIAAISLLIEARFGGPVMLYALVLGGLCHSAATHSSLKQGVNYSANQILKIGVALLGVKITVVDIANLGYQTAALVILSVAATMTVGTALGRVMGLKSDHAVLSAGSVGICGSSAALAIASVLPQNKETECNTIMTVITVTMLSTLAMVLYPFIASALNLTDTEAGIFIGATIHNVAQVVGAGFIVSEPAGEIATIVKLMRVACLLPVIVIISLIFRKQTVAESQDGKTIGKRPPLLPFFMVGFILIMLVNSLGFIPSSFSEALSQISRWALIIAVAGLGVKTSVKEVIGVGFKPVLVLTTQTIFLAAFALLAISFTLTL